MKNYCRNITEARSVLFDAVRSKLCVWALFCFCNRALGSCCIFLHFSITDQAQSQDTLNPKAKEFHPSFGASERLQTNGSNRYTYFTLLHTMDFNKNEVLYVIGVLYLCVEKEFFSEIHTSL